MGHNTYPLLVYEPLVYVCVCVCVCFGNSDLILQKSGLTTEKTVQRKENFFLMRDYAQQRCYNILCDLFLSAIFFPLCMPHSHTHILEVIGLRVWQWRVEKDDFSSSHNR